MKTFVTFPALKQPLQVNFMIKLMNWSKFLGKKFLFSYISPSTLTLLTQHCILQFPAHPGSYERELIGQK